MMKEVEGARKLKHVKCNDRSNPILTSKSVTKIEGQFIFETEKGNKLNELLNQISSGVKLRPTKTNDRSKPILQGLRKFRRQMTIEEQIQKSESRHVLNEELNVPDEESGDEMDDIDKLRDDLQSTKQLLSIELRNKEAQERESKRLLARIQNLEAELEIERNKVKTEDPNAEEEWPPSMPSTTPDEQLVKTLKEEASEAQKTSKLLEKKFQDTAEQLDNAKSEIEEQRKLVASLEKKLANQQVCCFIDVLFFMLFICSVSKNNIFISLIKRGKGLGELYFLIWTLIRTDCLLHLGFVNIFIRLKNRLLAIT